MSFLKLVARVAPIIIPFLTGCVDLQPVKKKIEAMQAELLREDAELKSLQERINNAESDARAARESSQQALAESQTSASCCQAASESLDRFIKSQPGNYSTPNPEH
jgi:septal ring factor EnvC (AmiA/AmiB activator)